MYMYMQVADDTGQVQYATQTVTVTENDAKALGQPVGSTTTVLLTAYPSQGGTETSESSVIHLYTNYTCTVCMYMYIPQNPKLFRDEIFTF